MSLSTEAECFMGEICVLLNCAGEREKQIKEKKKRKEKGKGRGGGGGGGGGGGRLGYLAEVGLGLS